MKKRLILSSALMTCVLSTPGLAQDFTNKNISADEINGYFINNTGTISDNISTDITNNTFTASDDVFAMISGGAIYNYSTGSITDITATFSGNTLSALSIDMAYINGGMINNAGEIENLTVNASDNTFFASGDNTQIAGGVIYNTGDLTLSDSTFTNNEVLGAATSQGAAIYNSGTMSLYGTNSFTTASDTIYNSGTMTIINKGTLFNNSTITNSGTMTNYGTLFNNSTITNTGALIFDEGSTYQFTTQSLIEGNVKLSGGVYLETLVSLDNNSGIYNFITGNIESGRWDVVDNVLYDIDLDDTKTSVEINAKKSSKIAETLGASSNQINAIMAIIEGGDSDSASTTFDTIASDLHTALQLNNDVAGVLSAIDAINPDSTSSVAYNTMINTARLLNMANTRFDKNNENIWAQGAFSAGDNSDTTTLALGGEMPLTQYGKIGMGYAYTTTDMDTTTRTMDMESNSIMLYGTYKPSDFYINTAAIYTHATIDEASSMKTADYTADTIALQAIAGYDIALGNTIITPNAGMRYMHINQEGYHDSFGSYIAGDSGDIFTAIIGADIQHDVKLPNDITLTPTAGLHATYDLTQNTQNGLITLANGAQYITTSEKIDKFGLEITLALTAQIKQNLSLTLDYQATKKSDDIINTGNLKAQYNF